ncbi:hypothetical protein HD554DRAFT_2015042, partial [Boletus coccyginus]
FNNAQDLCTHIESLPDVPCLHYQEITVKNYPTTFPIVLYWQDGLKVVEYLFSNHIFGNYIDLEAYKDFEVRSNGAQQDNLPPSYLFLGMIRALDKTPLMMDTGNKEMHLLMLSIANIHAGICIKATSHLFVLVAYLPILKFHNVPPLAQSILTAQIYHHCVSIVVKNLITANRYNKEISDLAENFQVMCKSHISWIADYPE